MVKTLPTMPSRDDVDDTHIGSLGTWSWNGPGNLPITHHTLSSTNISQLSKIWTQDTLVRMWMMHFMLGLSCFVAQRNGLMIIQNGEEARGIFKAFLSEPSSSLSCVCGNEDLKEGFQQHFQACERQINANPHLQDRHQVMRAWLRAQEVSHFSKSQSIADEA